jgi:2-succinyl-6-hydroxy-2,4-cyclohexadiene-1-carboxylate synthase
MTRVVLVHGFTGSPASFEDLLAYLHGRQPRLRAFCPVLLGHGLERDAPIARFEQEVDRLAAQVQQAGFSGAHLCGYSLGARLSVGLLGRHARLFSGATLIGLHPGLASAAERAARVGSDERWCQLLARGGLQEFLRAWQAQALFGTQRQLPAPLLARQQAIREHHTAEGLQRSLRVVGLGQMPDLRGVLLAQPLRVRLLVGALDAKFVALAQHLAAATGVVWESVAGAGHNLLLEAPDLLARVLSRALEASA